MTEWGEGWRAINKIQGWGGEADYKSTSVYSSFQRLSSVRMSEWFCVSKGLMSSSEVTAMDKN